MIRDQILEEFTEALASSDPVPGGGGASCLAGAIGVSLGAMVCSLTEGKKKYADVEEEIRSAKKYLLDMREVFYRLADKDEEVFLPLSKAYSLPRKTEEEKKTRDSFLALALSDAASVPMSALETAVSVMPVLRTVAEKGSKLAVSDAGVAASYLRTCMEGAAFNIRINTGMMKDPAIRERMEEKCARLLEYGIRETETVSEIVRTRIS